MDQRFTGAICITDLLAKLKSGKFYGFTSEHNGKKYIAIDAWLRDTPDQYGNSLSVRLSLKKEYFNDPTAKKEQYIANMKLDDRSQNNYNQGGQNQNDFGDDDDMPF